MFLVILILHSVWPLLRESALILLQTVPTHIEVDAIQRRLLERVDGVLAVHEFHVWQLAGDRIIASAHIRCRNLSEYMKLAEKVKEFFHNEGIHSTTIQPEFIEVENGNSYTTSDGISTSLNISGKQEEGCVLDCPNIDENCVKATCCQNNNSKVSFDDHILSYLVHTFPEPLITKFELFRTIKFI
jgi:solute carrier family 30 (zinc transporter), member 1